jgi:hypothetical protein
MSRSEISVRTVAIEIAATTNSPCDRERESFGTIPRADAI